MGTGLLTDLNEQQRQVAQAVKGPVLVLAGAGSGKTRTLTYRIAYLIQQGLAAPEEILALTFTNKAAGEMKERVGKLVSRRPAAIGTFHAMGAKILREQARQLPRSTGFMICDAGDSERLVRQAMSKLNISRKEHSPRKIKHVISRAKSEGTRPEELAVDETLRNAEMLAEIYQHYEKLLAANDAYDFDDLLVEPLRLLEQNGDVRQTYRGRWRYLSVDEYQDTNMIQDRWLKLLLGPEKNICAVGDDYQAIYSWRGARVENILQFHQTFPECQTFYLTKNYRSTQSILTAAGKMIAANTDQMHKDLWTEEKGGGAVQLVTLSSSRQEAVWVRGLIESEAMSGGRRGDIVILYRTNAQSRQFEEEFLTHGIPYTIVGGFRFYERREIKDALALLQFWQTPTALALHRLSEALWRGIGPKTLDRWAEETERGGLSLAEVIERESKARPVLQQMACAYRQARDQKFETVADLLSFLLKKTGYETHLKAQPDGEERWENIEELLNVTAGYEEVDKFLEDAALLSDIDTLEEEQDRVTCMTLHASKGLEFETVILSGCEEGLLPHINSLDNKAQVEEERRLMYVGMTRAKQKLVLTCAQTRWRNGSYEPQIPSRFLASLDDAVEQVDAQYDQVAEGDLLPTPDIIRADLL